MNEWILAGLVIAGSVIAMGGGRWVVNPMAVEKSPPTPKA